jgi:hypothetical protein
VRRGPFSRGTHFTCFTSKKVEILTPEELLKDDFNQTHSTFLAEQEQMDYEVCRFFFF